MRIDDVIETLFAPARDPRARWLVRPWLILLYAGGLVAWSYLLGWGTTSLEFHDWTGINLPRLEFLQNALRAGAWPMHMAGTASLHGVTDRYLSLPDVITSPQALLLLVMPVRTFVLVDILMQFSLGFAGLLLLRRYADWSLFTFTIVFLMFLFNGHILAHYSVGHFTWAAYYMFPFVAVLLLRFLDGDASVRGIAWFATASFYMVLTGGQHHLTWVLLLLALLVPFCWNRAWWLVACAAASLLLSAVRLLPPALELGSFRNAGLVADVIGYPSVSHLLASLVWLRREAPVFNEQLPGNIWFFDSAFYEFNAYIGAVGFAMLVIGLYLWLRASPMRYWQLAWPVAIMTTWSIGSIYRVVRATSIPLLEGERYTARMFSLPLFLMILLAATALDRHLRAAAERSWQRGLALAALLFLAIDVSGSVRLWKVSLGPGLFGATTYDPASAAVVTRADPAYSTIVLTGTAISIATALVLAILVYRERQRARASA